MSNNLIFWKSSNFEKIRKKSIFFEFLYHILISKSIIYNNKKTFKSNILQHLWIVCKLFLHYVTLSEVIFFRNLRLKRAFEYFLLSCLISSFQWLCFALLIELPSWKRMSRKSKLKKIIRLVLNCFFLISNEEKRKATLDFKALVLLSIISSTSCVPSPIKSKLRPFKRKLNSILAAWFIVSKILWLEGLFFKWLIIKHAKSLCNSCFFLNKFYQNKLKKKQKLLIYLFVFDFLQNLNKFMTSVISWFALQPVRS